MLDQNPTFRPTIEKLISALSRGLVTSAAIQEIKCAVQSRYPSQIAKYISEHRHNSAADQREYDRHFGLTL
jgi:hypothetical protein